MEIDELKKRKNREIEDIKRVKVEMHKMEQLYKKMKEITQSAPSVTLAQFNLASLLPFSLGQPNEAMEVAQWISTEELLVETAKVKNMLNREIINFKRHQNAE